MVTSKTLKPPHTTVLLLLLLLQCTSQGSVARQTQLEGQLVDSPLLDLRIGIGHKTCCNRTNELPELQKAFSLYDKVIQNIETTSRLVTQACLHPKTKNRWQDIYNKTFKIANLLEELQNYLPEVVVGLKLNYKTCPSVETRLVRLDVTYGDRTRSSVGPGLYLDVETQTTTVRGCSQTNHFRNIMPAIKGYNGTHGEFCVVLNSTASTTFPVSTLISTTKHKTSTTASYLTTTGMPEHRKTTKVKPDTHNGTTTVRPENRKTTSMSKSKPPRKTTSMSKSKPPRKTTSMSKSKPPRKTTSMSKSKPPRKTTSMSKSKPPRKTTSMSKSKPPRKTTSMSKSKPPRKTTSMSKSKPPRKTTSMSKSKPPRKTTSMSKSTPPRKTTSMSKSTPPRKTTSMSKSTPPRKTTSMSKSTPPRKTTSMSKSKPPRKTTSMSKSTPPRKTTSMSKSTPPRKTTSMSKSTPPRKTTSMSNQHHLEKLHQCLINTT
ncbi:uncharacterized protein [Cherax quadricarinatus]|uniref:uncharacterized protein n=1 Tax=Cherax quadricarinatus TaxID=27406 RepID=UPI00387E26A5